MRGHLESPKDRLISPNEEKILREIASTRYDITTKELVERRRRTSSGIGKSLSEVRANVNHLLTTLQEKDMIERVGVTKEAGSMWGLTEAGKEVMVELGDG